MIRPYRPRIIQAPTALEKRNVPFRFVSITSCQALSSIRSIRPSRVTPALLTRT